MAPVFTRHTCDIDTNEDACTCEDGGGKKYPRSGTETQRKKEGTPNARPGYKLGAVGVTMYINSHTSF